MKPRRALEFWVANGHLGLIFCTYIEDKVLSEYSAFGQVLWAAFLQRTLPGPCDINSLRLVVDGRCSITVSVLMPDLAFGKLLGHDWKQSASIMQGQRFVVRQ